MRKSLHLRDLTVSFNTLAEYTRHISTEVGADLIRSYGRCIAEFLSEGSLVSLSLLDSSTCVGLRYGRT